MSFYMSRSEKRPWKARATVSRHRMRGRIRRCVAWRPRPLPWCGSFGACRNAGAARLMKTYVRAATPEHHTVWRVYFFQSALFAEFAQSYLLAHETAAGRNISSAIHDRRDRQRRDRAAPDAQARQRPPGEIRCEPYAAADAQRRWSRRVRRPKARSWWHLRTAETATNHARYSAFTSV